MITGYVGKTCPYCQYAITEDVEVYVCPECQSPHHRECWTENGGCTTFGCRYAPIVGPAAQPRMNAARVQSRAIASAGISGGVICPYCGETTTNSMTDCEHCHRVLYSGFWNRLWAFMFDKVVLAIANYLLIIILMIPLFIIVGLSDKSGNPGTIIGIVMMIGFFAAPLIFNWLYYAICESSTWRGTPGKMIMALVVTDLEGRQLSFWRASARYFASLLSLLLLFTGYIAAAFTPRKQALHDIITGSLVARSVRPDAQGNDENVMRRRVMGILMGLLLFVFTLIPLGIWLTVGRSVYYGIRAENAFQSASNYMDNETGQSDKQYQASKYEEAMEFYTKSIDAGVTLPDSYERRAECYKELGRYREAIADYSRGLKGISSRPGLYLDRGDCYRELKEYRSALLDYTEYIESSEEDSNGSDDDSNDYYAAEMGYCRRAQVYFDLGQDDKALADLKTALELDPQYYDALDARGNYYLFRSEFKLAAADFTGCIEAFPDESEAYQNRARAYMGLGNYTLALADINYALELDPENPNNFVLRAQCRAEMNNPKEARLDYLKALAIDPKNEEAKQGAADLAGK